jgi:large subunit ribosomal protein L3
MGNNKVTTRGLRVVKVDAERNIVLVRGSVPGARNSLVRIERTNGNY